MSSTWSDTAMLATPLFILWLDTYVLPEDDEERNEVLNWDPETVLLELEEDHHVKVPQANLDKILAAREVFTSDRFFKDLRDFVDLCNVLSGDTFDPTSLDPADAVECAWGITEAMLLNPPDDDENPFADEIVGYVGMVCREEGILSPPDVLRIGDLKDRTAEILSAWADDAETVAEVKRVAAARTADLTQTVRERLTLLVRQIEALPLVHGDASRLVEKMVRAVPAASRAAE